MWLVFMGLVVALLAFDLGVLHKDDHEIGVAESLKLSVMYLSLGFLFAGFIYWQMDTEATAQYLTAFVVEKTLAMDNIFLIAMIFAFFSIPREYQHRVLFWGILGVIILRGIMIGLGATIVEQYNWVLYIFAVFLILTGIKMLFMADKEHKIEENGLIRFLKRHMNVTNELHGNRFVIRKLDPSTGKLKRYATPDLLPWNVLG
ncbi:TerC family protein, partial [Rhizobium straminoryzae]